MDRRVRRWTIRAEDGREKKSKSDPHCWSRKVCRISFHPSVQHVLPNIVGRGSRGTGDDRTDTGIRIDDKTHDTYSQTLRLRTDTAAITVSMHTNSGAPVLQSTPGPQNDLRPGESSLSRGWRRAHKRQQCSCHGPRTPTRLSSRRSSDPRPAHQLPSAPPTPGEREPPLSIVNDSPPHHSERPVMHCCHGRPAEFAPAVMALVRPE